ncbi:hypothetical protein PYCC9005_000921 [Savitreella phatthalungensis]
MLLRRSTLAKQPLLCYRCACNFPFHSRARSYATSTDDFRESASHYEVLDLPLSASTKQVKAQFYKLSKAWHPDVHSTSDEAHALASRKFQRINAAYATLKDPALRRTYDRSISATTTATTEPRPSGLSRRKTRPHGPPSAFGGGGGRTAGPRPGGGSETVRNAHFDYEEHRSRHSIFDDKLDGRVREEAAKRNAPSTASGANFNHPLTAQQGAGHGDDGAVGRFVAAACLVLVVALISAAGGSRGVKAEDGGDAGLGHRVDWHEAMRGAREDRHRLRLRNTPKHSQADNE